MDEKLHEEAHAHEYIGFHVDKTGQYALLISNGYEVYGGVREPVLKRIEAAELKPSNIDVTKIGKARLIRLPTGYSSEKIGKVHAQVRAGAKELKRRAVSATVGSLALTGAAHILADLLLPSAGEPVSKFVEKALKTCSWVADSGKDAVILCASGASAGFATEHASRWSRVIRFQLNVSISGTSVTIACTLPSRHFKEFFRQIQQQEDIDETAE